MYQRITSLNLRRVQVAVAVGEHRSVTEAAKRLNMTPPAVTKSLKELELGLATELFDRTSSGMVPTETGEVFLRHALRALHEIERARTEVSLLNGGEDGKVVIGCTADAYLPQLTRAMGKLMTKRSGVDVKLIGGTFEALLRETRAGALDFFIGIVPENSLNSNMLVDPLFQDRLRIVARPQHPLVSRDALKLTDLGECRWIFSNNEGPFLEGLKQSFEQSGLLFPAKPVIVEPISLVRGLLNSSDLISVMTKSRASEEVELGQLAVLPIDLDTTDQTISIVRKAEPYQSARSKELISFLKQEVSRSLQDLA